MTTTTPPSWPACPPSGGLAAVGATVDPEARRGGEMGAGKGRRMEAGKENDFFFHCVASSTGYMMVELLSTSSPIG